MKEKETNQPKGTDLSSAKITILVDNQAAPGLVAEHGLSFWIEIDATSILFDTGQGNALTANAHALGVDLKKTDMLVLSHGHYDHAGAANQVLAAAPDAHVYAHPALLKERYSIHDGRAESVAVPPESRQVLASLEQRRHNVTEPVRLAAGIELTGPIPRLSAFEDTGGHFYLDPRQQHPDLIEDDIALVIDLPGGLVVCVGCCHAGLINTLTFIRQRYNHRPIQCVMGGLHLLHAGGERMQRTVDALRQLDPARIIPCHCTGRQAVQQLQEALPGRVKAGHAGLSIHFS
jgi:7,8-dihydropterin-6-yl-methyl-4-(beta-D-ribofuranosyl)aminobenzene 5'-phosphate synthase